MGGMPQGVARDCKSLVLRDMLGSIPRLPTKQPTANRCALRATASQARLTLRSSRSAVA